MDAETYRKRRDHLRETGPDGWVLLAGNRPVPRNYEDNVFPFRQNSHVLYYSGIDRPDVVLVLGDSPAEDLLFGPPEGMDDVVWHGPHATLEEMAATAGLSGFRPLEALEETLRTVRAAGRALHWLPPYQARVQLWLSGLLGVSPEETVTRASRPLMKAVAEARLRKEEEEVAEIEEALGVTARMFQAAFDTIRPGIREAEVAAAMQRVALAEGRAQAYNPIVSVRGEVLHNDTHANTLSEGDLLLMDAGAESVSFYASDITRVVPVSGSFTEIQRGVYQAVLNAQLGAIEAMRPGVSFREIHLLACRVIVEGLKEVGIMRGDPEEAVAAGAHALFFPHGLGHALGLDVHDMEDLGDVVGYLEGERRSSVFGLNFLRFARPLEQGFVVTVEPGVYFIPALMERWRREDRCSEFIDHQAAAALAGFGGIRIEDDVLCTASGARVLGPRIPKTADEIEGVLRA